LGRLEFRSWIKNPYKLKLKESNSPLYLTGGVFLEEDPETKKEYVVGCDEMGNFYLYLKDEVEGLEN